MDLFNVGELEYSLVQRDELEFVYAKRPGYYSVELCIMLPAVW
jgi:hypothetical protein